MAPRADAFDLGALRLTPGEGRRIELAVPIDPFELAGQPYTVEPRQVETTLDVSKTNGDGYALRLRFEARIAGPCMRCLEPAAPLLQIDAREISQPREGEELRSPYVNDGLLDLRGWARDALALALPAQILCTPDCAGLCAICGADLNQTGPDHVHDQPADPRWAKLAELKFDR